MTFCIARAYALTRSRFFSASLSLCSWRMAAETEESLRQVFVGRYGVLYMKDKKEPVVQGPREVDLRSDTVTKPTDEMRAAMFGAEVGDDVYGDDPTVKKLEEKASEMFGKEAALYVPSGTMGNLISVMAHCFGRGEEVLLGDSSHISVYEQGGIAQLGGVHPRTVRNLPDGTLDLDEVKSKIMPDNIHNTVTRLICVENTHNGTGGRVIRPEFMDKLAEIVCGTNIKIHMDGARIFNAATALEVPVIKLLEHADSVSVCLSKGLGAPIGSVISGNKEFIGRARRLRKVLGGGMRQAGVIAAPALIALETMSKNLHIDHSNAKRLAQGLAAMMDVGIEINPSIVETNIVLFRLVREDMTANEFANNLASYEKDQKQQVIVKLVPYNTQLIRAVTHHQVNQEDIDLTLEKMNRILRKS